MRDFRPPLFLPSLATFMISSCSPQSDGSYHASKSVRASVTFKLIAKSIWETRAVYRDESMVS